MKLLENKTALVTGASRGIGKRIALMLAENGANIVFTDLREDDNSKATCEEISAFGVKVSFYASDATNYDDAVRVVEDALKVYGSIDILVNNAGITRDNLLLRMSPQDWDAVLNCNLKSVFNYTKALVPSMMKKRFGSIINISSIVGVNGNAGQGNYAASKAGIIGFTKSIAKEVGSRNIRCNAVAPGYIETDMTGKLDQAVRETWIKNIPLRRAGNPTDVAKTVLYLACDLSDYINGQVLCCDGGLSIC